MLIVLSIVICLLSVCNGFSDGRLFVDGNPAIKRMYCHRPALARPPIHLDAECKGLCRPKEGADQHFAVEFNGSESTYWIDGIDVIIRARDKSAYNVTGFTIYAISDKGHVVGSFDESDDVIVASCDEVLHNTVEGSFAVHRRAEHGRQSVKVRWSPDGYNHKNVKFHVWVVHNHSHIFNLESEELTSEKNGNDALDVNAIFQSLMGNVEASLSQFENTFTDRQSQGYNIELDDPFSPFHEEPSRNDLVPGYDQINVVDEDNLINPSGVRGRKVSFSRRPRLSGDDMSGVNGLGSRGNVDSLILSALMDKGVFESGLFHIGKLMPKNVFKKGDKRTSGLGEEPLDVDAVNSGIITESSSGKNQDTSLENGNGVGAPRPETVKNKETKDRETELSGNKLDSDKGGNRSTSFDMEIENSMVNTGRTNELPNKNMGSAGSGDDGLNVDKNNLTKGNSSVMALEVQETTTTFSVLQEESTSKDTSDAIVNMDGSSLTDLKKAVPDFPEENHSVSNDTDSNVSMNSTPEAPRQSVAGSVVTGDHQSPKNTGSSNTNADNNVNDAEIKKSEANSPKDLKGTKDTSQMAQDSSFLSPNFDQMNENETKRFKRQSEKPTESLRTRQSFISSPPSWAMGPQMAVPGPPGNMPSGGNSIANGRTGQSPLSGPSSAGTNGMRMPPQGMMGMPQSGMGMSPQNRMGMMQQGMAMPQSGMGMMSQSGMGKSQGQMGANGMPPQGSFNNGMRSTANNQFMQSGGSSSMMGNSFNPMMQQGNPMQQNQQFGGLMMGQQSQLGSPSSFPIPNGQASSLQNGPASQGQQANAASQKPASKPFLIPGQSPPSTSSSSSSSNPFGSNSGQPIGSPNSFPLGGPSGNPSSFPVGGPSGSSMGPSGQNPFSRGGQNPFGSYGQGQNGNPFASSMPGQSQFPGQFGQAPMGPSGFPTNSQMSFGQQSGATMPGSNPMFNQQNQFGSGFNQQRMTPGQFGMSGGSMMNNGMPSMFSSSGFNGMGSGINGMNNPWSSSNSFMGGNSGSRYGYPGNAGNMGMTNPFSSMMTRPSSAFSSNPFSSMGSMGSMSSIRNSMMGSMGGPSSRGYPGMTSGGMSQMMNRGGMPSSMMGRMPPMMGRGMPSMTGMGSMSRGMPSMGFPTVSISRNSRRG